MTTACSPSHEKVGRGLELCVEEEEERRVTQSQERMFMYVCAESRSHMCLVL